MQIISHYVSREFLKMTLVCLGTFVLIYLLVEILEKLDDFGNAGVPADQTLRYFLYIIPGIVKQMVPVAILMGTQLTFGVFSKNNQLIAFKSSGISMIRISAPILMLSMVASLTVFIMGEGLIPLTNGRALEIWNLQVKKVEARAVLINERIWYKGDRAIYSFDQFNFQEQKSGQATLYFFDPQFQLEARLDAAGSSWQEQGWRFYNGIYQTYRAGNNLASEPFKEKQLQLSETPEDFRYKEKSGEEMTFSELTNNIEKVQREGYEANPYRVERQMRLAFPVVSVIMALIGISMALRKEKGIGVAQGIVTSLAVTFLYWVFFGFSRSIGLAGIFPAFWAAWSSNILFLLIGGYFLMNIRQ
jgi:lipopolysaccharide export system permease protein